MDLRLWRIWLLASSVLFLVASTLDPATCDKSLFISCATTACDDLHAECIYSGSIYTGSWCNCDNATCSVGGACLIADNITAGPTAAPVTSGPTAAPTPRPSETICRDLNVTSLNGGPVAWEGWTFPWSFGNLKEVRPNTCAELAPSEKSFRVLEAFVTTATKQYNQFVSFSMMFKGGANWGVPAGAFISFFHAIWRLEYYISNMCTADVNNREQLFWADPFNWTKSVPMYASQACCACGGGTTSWMGQNPVVRAGLAELYAAANGQHWVRSDGWKGERHYCMW